MKNEQISRITLWQEKEFIADYRQKAETFNSFCDKQCTRTDNVCKLLAKNIKLYGKQSLSKISILQTHNLVFRK